MEEHLTGLPKPKMVGMDYLEVEHLTANESRVQMILDRRSFLIDEIKQLKNEIALRPNPSKVSQDYLSSKARQKFRSAIFHCTI